jgi:hypothetical protein
VCLGSGDGTFQAAKIYAMTDTTAGGVVVGDFNGDHIPDAAVRGSDGTWLYFGNGDGTFQAPVLALPSTTVDAAAD